MEPQLGRPRSERQLATAPLPTTEDDVGPLYRQKWTDVLPLSQQETDRRCHTVIGPTGYCPMSRADFHPNGIGCLTISEGFFFIIMKRTFSSLSPIILSIFL